jgi:hypothetical protein
LKKRKESVASKGEENINVDPILRDGYIRSLHDMATRAEEDGQYRPEEDPYYAEHAVNHDPYGQNAAAGPSGTGYQHQQQTDLDLGANTIYGHLSPLMGDHQNMQPMRDMYHTGLDLGSTSWDVGYQNHNGNISLNQIGELPMSHGHLQEGVGEPRVGNGTHSLPHPHSAGDQHGIEHAAALLSMAYQMHKERKPSQEEISPTSGTSSSRNRGAHQNNANVNPIDPGVQQGWPPSFQPDEHHYIRLHNVLAAGTLFDEDPIDQPQGSGSGRLFDSSIYLPSNQMLRAQDVGRIADPGSMSVWNGGILSAPQPSAVGSGIMSTAGIESWAGVRGIQILASKPSVSANMLDNRLTLRTR